MRTSQTLNLEMSEKRSELADVTARLNTAAGAGTDPSQEDIGKADTATREIRSLEVRYRASVLEEEEADRKAQLSGDMDPETRELAGLETRSKVGAYVLAAAEMRSVSGAEAEFNAAIKIGANQVPLRLFAPTEAELQRLEKRTETNVNTTIRPRRWVDRLFATTAASHLGIMMESVEQGQASFPYTSGGGTPAQRGREEATAVGAWTIAVKTLSPTRQSIHYRHSIEDAARVPGLEEALTRDMRMALQERLDATVFAGDSTGDENDIAGFFAKTGVSESTLTQALKLKWPETVQKFAAFLDGKHAEAMEDLRIVASVGANALWLGTQANTNRNESLAQIMRGNGLSWRTRAGIDANTANGDFMAAIGLGRGIEGAGVLPIWQGADLIRDPFSGAGKGQVQITLHALWNWDLVRTSNFKRLKAVT